MMIESISLVTEGVPFEAHTQSLEVPRMSSIKVNHLAFSLFLKKIFNLDIV